MFEIPEDPDPGQLHHALKVCTNQLARVGRLVTQYKTEVARAKTRYHRTYAHAVVLHSEAGNMQLVKSLAEVEANVVAAADELDEKVALFTLAKGEFDSWEAYFIALRKIAEVRKVEISKFLG
jgi:hypothetical protein